MVGRRVDGSSRKGETGSVAGLGAVRGAGVVVAFAGGEAVATGESAGFGFVPPVREAISSGATPRNVV
jgi:hypothetical protein